MSESTLLSSQVFGSVRRIYWALLVVSTVAAAVLLEDRTVIAGVSVGALVGLVNFEGLRWLGLRILQAVARSRTFYAALFLGKMTFVFALVWWLLSLPQVDPVGFLIGFSLLLPAVGLIGLRHALAPAAVHHGGGG